MKRIKSLVIYTAIVLFIYGIIAGITYFFGADFPKTEYITLTTGIDIKVPDKLTISNAWNFLAGIIFVCPIVLIATRKKSIREHSKEVIYALVISGFVVGIICGRSSVSQLQEGVGVYTSLVTSFAFSFLAGLTQGSLGYVLPLSAGLLITLFVGIIYGIVFVAISLVAVFLGSIFYFIVVKRVAEKMAR